MPKNKPILPHYSNRKIQPIDYMEANFTPDEYRGFLLGNVIKYGTRYQYKGEPIKDLEKALTYLTWLIEFERGRYDKPAKARNH